MNSRTATIERNTKETQISLSIDLDSGDESSLVSPVPFLNHMLNAFACHGGFALNLKADGDVEVDPHHLVEDVGIVLGQACNKALGDFGSIQRAGFFIFPMDGSLAQVAIDLCGRPNLIWKFDSVPAAQSQHDPLLYREFFKGFADNCRATLHCQVQYFDNSHHAIEALFKSFGRALRDAIQKNEKTIMSTKGAIDV